MDVAKARIFGIILGFYFGAAMTALLFISHERPTEWKDGGIITHGERTFILREMKDAK